MKISGEKVTVSINEDIDKGTERFLKFLVIIFERALNNPTYQLNILSMLLSGHPFVKLLLNNEEGDKAILNSMKSIGDTLKLSTIDKLMSNSTIDDILGK